MTRKLTALFFLAALMLLLLPSPASAQCGKSSPCGKSGKYSKEGYHITQRKLFSLHASTAMLDYTSINGISLSSRVPNYGLLAVDFPILKGMTLGLQGSYRSLNLPLPLDLLYSRHFHLFSVGPTVGAEFPFVRGRSPRYTGLAVRVELGLGYAYMWMRTNAEKELIGRFPDMLMQKRLHGLNTRSVFELRYYLPHVYFGVGFAYDYTRLYNGRIAGFTPTKSGHSSIASAMPIFTIGFNLWEVKTEHARYSSAKKQLKAKCCR